MKNMIRFFVVLALACMGFTSAIGQKKVIAKKKQISSTEKQGRQKKAIFKGQINGLKDPFAFMLVYLYNDGKSLAMDSVTVDASGKFSYSKELNETVMSRLFQPGKETKTGPNEKDSRLFPEDSEFLLEPGKEVILNADASAPGKLNWRGNAKNITYQQFKLEMSPLMTEERMLSYEVVDKRGQQEAVIELSAKIDSLRKRMHALSLQFVTDNPDNYGGLHDLENRMGHYDNKGDELAAVFNALSPALQMDRRGQGIKARLSNKKASESGAVAPIFTAVGQNDETIDLAALKGKYVVLDFWGSWCGPCRASHPGLIKLYHKYKEKGLEIIGVADEGGDPSKANDSWLKAIKEDEVGIWPHILNDREKAKMDIAKAYSIGAFPTKILIGKEGEIIGRYVGIGGSDLMKKKLEELLGF